MTGRFLALLITVSSMFLTAASANGFASEYGTEPAYEGIIGAITLSTWIDMAALLPFVAGTVMVAAAFIDSWGELPTLSETWFRVLDLLWTVWYAVVVGLSSVAFLTVLPENPGSFVETYLVLPHLAFISVFLLAGFNFFADTLNPVKMLFVVRDEEEADEPTEAPEEATA